MQTMFEVAPTALFTVPRYMQKFASQVLVGPEHHLAGQARGLQCRDEPRPQGRAPPLGRPGRRRHRYDEQRRARHRLRPRAEQARPRQARTCDFRRRAAAAGNRRALADLGRQSGRGLWPDRNRRRLHLRPGPALSRKPGNVGTVVSGWQVRLDDEGQILVKGPDQFEGYWNQPDATQADRRCRRMAAYRRCRRMAGRQSAPDRPRARLHGDGRRQDHLALDRSRAGCAQAPISARRSCSATAANISPR